MLTLLALSFVAAAQQGYQAPNSTVGVSVGTPWLVSLRGEAWVGDEVSFELGAGTLGVAQETVGFDWAIRWRPDLACFGCDGRVMASLGVGVGGTVASDLTWDGSPVLDDPWGLGLGPDLAATGVYWFNPTVGAHLTGRVGFGAEAPSNDLGAIEFPGLWAFLTLGLAF